MMIASVLIASALGGAIERSFEKEELGETRAARAFLNHQTNFGQAGQTTAVGPQWTERHGYHCGGNGYEPLEDGTPYPWSPGSAGPKACVVKCLASRKCNAVVWRWRDRKCFWKSGVSYSTMHKNWGTGHDCYFNLRAARQARDPSGTYTVFNKKTPQARSEEREARFTHRVSLCRQYPNAKGCSRSTAQQRGKQARGKIEEKSDRLPFSVQVGEGYVEARLQRLLSSLEGWTSGDPLTEEQLLGIKKCEELTDNGCDACLVDTDCQYNMEDDECVYRQTADADVPKSSWAIRVEQCPADSTSGCGRFTDCTKCLDESDYKCLYDRSSGCVESETANWQTAFYDSSQC